MERNLSALGESPLRGQVSPIFTELRQMGVGEESGFDLLARRLTLAETQQDLIVSNRDIAIDLVEEGQRAGQHGARQRTGGDPGFQ